MNKFQKIAKRDYEKSKVIHFETGIRPLEKNIIKTILKINSFEISFLRAKTYKDYDYLNKVQDICLDLQSKLYKLLKKNNLNIDYNINLGFKLFYFPKELKNKFYFKSIYGGSY